MYIIKQMTDLSFPAIGEYFGKKHSTVISNCNTVREMMNADPVYSAEVEEMMRNLTPDPVSTGRSGVFYRLFIPLFKTCSDL